MERLLTGRKIIYTDRDAITDANVLDVLTKALGTHGANRGDISYLYDYYRGNQPILKRIKEIRPEICSRIVENRANEIVSFKVGYLMGEPVQYVSRGGDGAAADGIKELNEYMLECDKAAQDKELADWFTICGTACRIILPLDPGSPVPFEIHTLDPRDAFVVYGSSMGHPPLMGVYCLTNESGEAVYSVYTEDHYYEISGEKIVKSEDKYYGQVPIIEYPSGEARLGAFEIVLPLLDAINEVSSNRLDGVEQFIQSLLVLIGVDIEDETLRQVKELGGLKVPPGGDVRYLVQELSQSETQTLKDDLYQTVLTICGMPNRNGGSSTSDTGTAVIMRDGWSAAEARARDTEMMFRRSEKRFLRLALRCMSLLKGVDLSLGDIGIRFTRRNYENIQEKAQVLTTLLASDKIHPRLAFEHSGLFVDPETAYAVSEKYREEQEEKLLKELEGGDG